MRCDILGEDKRRICDVPVKQVDIITLWVRWIIVKWQVPGKHGIKNDPTTPDVNFATSVDAIAND